MKGLIVGLIVCVPLGPIGLLCMRRTLIDGWIAGLVSILGASLMDGIYCAVAGLGMTFISTFLQHEQVMIRLIGGLILLLVGARIFFARPPETTPQTRNGGLLGSFTSIILIMLTNPMPILVFSAAFTALGVYGWRGDYTSTAVLVAGVFCGSALWAPILVFAVRLFQSAFSAQQSKHINRISGIVMAGFGVALTIIALAR